VAGLTLGHFVCAVRPAAGPRFFRRLTDNPAKTPIPASCNSHTKCHAGWWLRHVLSFKTSLLFRKKG
jgi:hypothetical protein